MKEAGVLMLAFADRTGLTSERPPRRYLWTDAFAVCNLLELARMSGDDHFTDLALRAVDQVLSLANQSSGRRAEADSGWPAGSTWC